MEEIISRVSEKQRNASGLGAQARGEEDKCQHSVLGSQRRELRSEPPGRDGPWQGWWEWHHPLSEPDRSSEFRAVLSREGQAYRPVNLQCLMPCGGYGLSGNMTLPYTF